MTWWVGMMHSEAGHMPSQVLGADLARVLDRARELKEQWGDKYVSAEHLLQACEPWLAALFSVAVGSHACFGSKQTL